MLVNYCSLWWFFFVQSEVDWENCDLKLNLEIGVYNVEVVVRVNLHQVVTDRYDNVV